MLRSSNLRNMRGVPQFASGAKNGNSAFHPSVTIYPPHTVCNLLTAAKKRTWLCKHICIRRMAI